MEIVKSFFIGFFVVSSLAAIVIGSVELLHKLGLSYNSIVDYCFFGLITVLLTLLFFITGEQIRELFNS